MNKEFRCKGRRLAYYLVQHGSTFIRYERENGDLIFIFKHDETIDENIGQWKLMSNRCMF